MGMTDQLLLAWYQAAGIHLPAVRFEPEFEGTIFCLARRLSCE